MKHTAISFCVTLAALFGVFVLLLRGRTDAPGMEELQGYLYAHRGYHNKPNVPENSLAAFTRAVERGYGAEFDVHLLADGGLAVIHDSELKRTTGADGVVESLTTAQLADYRLEGTAEAIPTFQQTLDVFGGKTPLIIELKTYKSNAAALCRAVCAVLDEYDGPYCIESFDPRCIYWLRKHRPDIIRGQLADNFIKDKAGLPAVMQVALTYLLFNVATRPDFIAYNYHERNTAGNVLCRGLWRVAGASWTLRSKDELTTAQSEGCMPIFECFDPDTDEQWGAALNK